MKSDEFNQEYVSQQCLQYPIQLKIIRIIDENRILIKQQKNHEIQLKYELSIITNTKKIIQPIFKSQLILKTNKELKVSLNYNYSNLQYNDLLVIQIYNNQKILGSSVISFFNENLQLRRNINQLAIWPNVFADISNDSFTNGFLNDNNFEELKFMNQKQQYFIQNMNNFSDQDNKTLENLNNKIYYTYRKIPIAFLELDLCYNINNINEQIIF